MDWDDQIQVREYHRRWRAKNKEKYNALGKKWKNANKDKLKEHFNKYRQSPKGIKMRRIHGWRQQGIKCDGEWDELYEWYQTTTNCNICGASFQDVKRCLDHDHTIEGYNVRQVLCYSCNQFHNEL